MKSIIKYDSIHNFNSGHRHLIDGPPRKLAASIHVGQPPFPSAHSLQHMLLYIQQTPTLLPRLLSVELYSFFDPCLVSGYARRAQKGKQRDSHKQLSTLPLTQLYPIRMFACLSVHVGVCACVCVWVAVGIFIA